MKVAFFSDVHANFEALKAMLASSEDCAERYCCGDLVGYGDRPNEVVDEIRQLQIPTVIGNHDLFALGRLEYNQARDSLYRASWTRSVLNQEHADWLGALPSKIELDGPRITLTHASPWDVQTYLYPDSEQLLKAIPEDGSTLVVGHCHHAYVCPGPNGTVVNCGSVGFPRSGTAGAQYMVLETATGAWSHRCATYDIEALAERLTAEDWHPDVIAKLLSPQAKPTPRSD